MFFFFFQAEDGIRDDLVTGVQTCALPISQHSDDQAYVRALMKTPVVYVGMLGPRQRTERILRNLEIGRASCRERVSISVVTGSRKKKEQDRVSTLCTTVQ